MTADEFGRRICLPLIRGGHMLADSEPHRLLEQTCKDVFPEVVAALRAEWEREETAEAEVGRPTLPSR